MTSYYYQNLIKSVLEASTTDKWEIAVREWDIVDCQEDEKHLSECVCGKENLRYLFTIRNRKTGISLYPIGSTCIEKFGRDDLDSEVNVQLDMYHLVHAIESGERIIKKEIHMKCREGIEKLERIFLRLLKENCRKKQERSSLR